MWWALTEAARGHDEGHLVEGKPGRAPEGIDPDAPLRRPESEVGRTVVAHLTEA